jgi:hypothetical protein
MNHLGGHLAGELLKAFLGKARFEQFGAWYLICFGVVVLVLLPIRLWRVKRQTHRPWLWVLVSLLPGVALVALGGVVMANKGVSATDAIQDAGGDMTRDETMPGKPVVRVDFERGFRRWYDLASLRPHLEGLPQLRHLRIASWARVSGADLVHLEGLTQVKTIELYGPISKSAIERLRKKLPDAHIVTDQDALDFFPTPGPRR